jgi:hypothetical protein
MSLTASAVPTQMLLEETRDRQLGWRNLLVLIELPGRSHRRSAVQIEEMFRPNL